MIAAEVITVETPTQWAGFCLACVAIAAFALLAIAAALLSGRRSYPKPPSADVAEVRDLGARLTCKHDESNGGRALGVRSPRTMNPPVHAGGGAVHAQSPASDPLYDQRRDIGWMQQLLVPKVGERS